jgi:hypothetical protein
MIIKMQKILQSITFVLFSFFLASCASTPSNPEGWMEMEKNACLPTAIAFREGLKKYDVWSEVVIYNWTDQKTKKNKAHAIVAYMYPKGQNKLWTYDHWGSYRVRAYKDDPFEIAQKATDARHEERRVTSAFFLKKLDAW